MGKLKYLSKNILLFSISNFVSKILVFLLVPFYTNVLSTYEYGVADVMQVTLLLLVPMVTLNIGEAALRFGIEETDKRKDIFIVGIGYVIRAIVFIAVVCLLFIGLLRLNLINISADKNALSTYLALFIFLFAANALYEFLILFFQGCEMVGTVVLGSVFCTVFTIGFNLYFLLLLKTGLNGYLYSQIFAYLLASVLMLTAGSKNNEAEVVNAASVKGSKEARGNKCIDNDIEKRMLEYSRPMVVYSTAGWINNAVDRYFVLLICGANVNGIYGVAYKIPAILMVFQRIFAQAWQLSATKAHKDADSPEFYSGMYKVYNCFMVIGCAFLILIVRPLAMFLFRKDFFSAWQFVPHLLISVLFGALTGFLGSICLAYKDSKSMGISTGIGAAVNVLLNFLLIPGYGAMGAAAATAVSYFVMCLFSLIFVKKHVRLTIHHKRNFISYILLCEMLVIMIKQVSGYYVICTLIFAVISALYFKDISEIINVFTIKLKGMFKNQENERTD